MTAAPPKDLEFIVEPVRIGDLRLDARYQREVRESDVERIVNDYRPELFQPIVVGMRDDGALHIVDGQHRVAAARKLGWTEVPCMIFESRGYEHEAEVFEKLQTNRAILTVPQRWKARLARKEPVATAANAVVEALGLRLAPGEVTPTSLCCYSSVERAHLRGNLRDTLVLIIQAWEYDVTGFRSTFIDAVSIFLSALSAEGKELDMARLRDALAKVKPSQFLRETAIVGNKPAALLKRVLDTYNKGLQKNRVEINDPVAFINSATRMISAKKAIDSGASALFRYHDLPPEKRTERAKKAAATRNAARWATLP